MNDRLRLLWQLRTVVLGIFVLVLLPVILVMSAMVKDEPPVERLSTKPAALTDEIRPAPEPDHPKPNPPIPYTINPKGGYLTWVPPPRGIGYTMVNGQYCTLVPPPLWHTIASETPGGRTPVSPDEITEKEPETSDIPAGGQNAESSQSYPCECTPTCPCEGTACDCRGKSRCSDVCPCHKQIAKFWCPTCKRNGYCDMEPGEYPHRVCRDCKLWMDRLEPPMTAKETKAVIYWRNRQRWMQAQKEQEAERVQRHYQRPAPMPTFNPWQDAPTWQPRRMFRSTSACST